MVQKRIIPALAAALFLTLAHGAMADGFLSVMDDLPLAPGLTETPGAVQFDSPGGQIIDATASGNVNAQQISGFYAQTLPQLGWERLPDGRYRRDDEILRIDVDGHKQPAMVHFSVVPQ